jgi:predicted transcriptional regulator YheO
MRAYQVIDAMTDGIAVMCLNRDTLNVAKLNKLSFDMLAGILKEAEASEKDASYPHEPKYEFFYAEVEEEIEPEVNADDTVSDVSSSERTV